MHIYLFCSIKQSESHEILRKLPFAVGVSLQSFDFFHLWNKCLCAGASQFGVRRPLPVNDFFCGVQSS
jgi:hypothetical protein